MKAVASVTVAFLAMLASVDQWREGLGASAARVSWLVANDSESRIPSAGMRLVRRPCGQWQCRRRRPWFRNAESLQSISPPFARKISSSL